MWTSACFAPVLLSQFNANAIKQDLSQVTTCSALSFPSSAPRALREIVDQSIAQLEAHGKLELPST